jgi:predicted NAD/FAD-dependent oxidoreductase
MRLFFDVMKQASHAYDYHGGDFVRPEDAAQMAELIAADLGLSETGDWVGSQVVVRNAAGETLFSIPVRLAA